MVKRKSPLSLVQALLPPNQEVMGEQDHRHMMVPPAPESKFVVVHAQFPFAFGKTRLDGEAASRSPAQTSRVVFPGAHYGG